MKAGNRFGIQFSVQQVCTNIIFLHFYAHKLKLILLYYAKSIKQVQHFMYNLSACHSFFSISLKRTQLFENKRFKIPQACTTCNFNSIAVQTVRSKYVVLKGTFLHVIENDEEWDLKFFNSAIFSQCFNTKLLQTLICVTMKLRTLWRNSKICKKKKQ